MKKTSNTVHDLSILIELEEIENAEFSLRSLFSKNNEEYPQSGLQGVVTVSRANQNDIEAHPEAEYLPNEQLRKFLGVKEENFIAPQDLLPRGDLEYFIWESRKSANEHNIYLVIQDTSSGKLIGSAQRFTANTEKDGAGVPYAASIAAMDMLFDIASKDKNFANTFMNNYFSQGNKKFKGSVEKLTQENTVYAQKFMDALTLYNQR